MCYDDAARPPEPAGAKGSARGEDIVLTASDGNRFLAYLATPSQPSEAQIIIYPDVRGLHLFYKELALRFAEVGIKALAIDYFGRTAGLTSRDESFEYMPHVQQIDMDKFTLDVQAALGNLHNVGGSAKPIFVVGFCMGGSLTLMTGTNPDLGFAGLLPFYAGLSRDRGGKGTVLQNAPRVRYPVLAQFGGDDQGIPEHEIKQLDEALDTAGVEHRIIVYPGAPHSFFDRRQTEFADASANAWKQMLEFIAKHKVPVAS
jgi:carboxymethylenebutenolidase